MELLNLTEETELKLCEAVIGTGLQTFTEVGTALLTIRDKRLYRTKYSAFEDYCKDTWALSKPYATRLIQAAEVAENLKAVPIGTNSRPTAESQLRPLTKLSGDQQREAWTKAVESAPNGKPTAKHVEAAVEEIMNESTDVIELVPKQQAHESGGNEEVQDKEEVR